MALKTERTGALKTERTQMNLKSLSKTQIIENLKNLVAEERRLTTEILHYLKEVEEQKLYFDYGCKNMFNFIHQYLGYSEAATYRRLNALKLIQQIPEVAEKIQSGDLLMSVVANAQSAFKDSQLTIEEKRQVLSSLENKSTREAEKELFKIKPAVSVKESVRRISASETAIQILVDDALKAELDELNAFYSHQNPTQKYQSLIKLLVKKELKALRRDLEPSPKRKPDLRRSISPAQEYKTLSKQTPSEGKVLSRQTLPENKILLRKTPPTQHFACAGV